MPQPVAAASAGRSIPGLPLPSRSSLLALADHGLSRPLAPMPHNHVCVVALTYRTREASREKAAAGFQPLARARRVSWLFAALQSGLEGRRLLLHL